MKTATSQTEYQTSEFQIKNTTGIFYEFLLVLVKYYKYGHTVHNK